MTGPDNVDDPTSHETANAEVERLREQRDTIDADREALALGVWAAVHVEDGMPPLDTPRDRAEVIAAVNDLRASRDVWRRLAKSFVREDRDDWRAEVERLRERAEKDEAALRVVALWLGGPHHPSQPSDVEAIARQVGAEVERLRAIIDGRTTPPTREEIDVVVSAGGWWQCGTDDGEWGVSVCAHHCDVRDVLRGAAEQGVSLRWWAHDRTGRPWAWPAVVGDR